MVKHAVWCMALLVITPVVQATPEDVLNAALKQLSSPQLIQVLSDGAQAIDTSSAIVDGTSSDMLLTAALVYCGARGCEMGCSWLWNTWNGSSAKTGVVQQNLPSYATKQELEDKYAAVVTTTALHTYVQGYVDPRIAALQSGIDTCKQGLAVIIPIHNQEKTHGTQVHANVQPHNNDVVTRMSLLEGRTKGLETQLGIMEQRALTLHLGITAKEGELKLQHASSNNNNNNNNGSESPLLTRSGTPTTSSAILSDNSSSSSLNSPSSSRKKASNLLTNLFHKRDPHNDQQ